MAKKIRYKKFIPNKIRITSDAQYEVVWIDEFPHDHRILGEMRPNSKQIVINKNQTELECFKTFIHELIHGFSDENNLGFSESKTQEIEKALFKFLKLNNLLDIFNKS